MMTVGPALSDSEAGVVTPSRGIVTSREVKPLRFQGPLGPCIASTCRRLETVGWDWPRRLDSETVALLHVSPAQSPPAQWPGAGPAPELAKSESESESESESFWVISHIAGPPLRRSLPSKSECRLGVQVPRAQVSP